MRPAAKVAKSARHFEAPGTVDGMHPSWVIATECAGNTRTETVMKKFDLNIEKMLEHWETDHAIREVVANALDEQLLTKNVDIEIFQDKQKCWHIRDFGRGMKYQHLTQKENEKKTCHSNSHRRSLAFRVLRTP